MNEELRCRLRLEVCKTLAKYGESFSDSTGAVETILDNFARELVKAQREAFVAGAKEYSEIWGGGATKEVKAEAARRYPDA